jgi:hypothetical protein
MMGIARHSSPSWWGYILALTLAVGCGGGSGGYTAADAREAQDTGRRVPAANASEQQILKEVGRLRSGAKQRVSAQVTVWADETYTSAAAGRPCRMVHIEQSGNTTKQQLACKSADEWYFVPDVLGLNTPAR